MKTIYEISLLAFSDFAFPKPLVQTCHDHEADKSELDGIAGKAGSSDAAGGDEEGREVAHGSGRLRVGSTKQLSGDALLLLGQGRDDSVNKAGR